MPVSLTGRTDIVPRYLDQAFIEPTLNRGKAIECFLGPGGDYQGEPTIRWISLRKEDVAFVARLYEALDPRNPEFLDIYALRFTAEEPDEPVREERHDTLEAALAQVREWGGDSGRFVNEGMAATSTATILREPANKPLQAAGRVGRSAPSRARR
jgi:hypothetical protein